MRYLVRCLKLEDRKRNIILRERGNISHFYSESPVKATWHSCLTEGDENVSRYEIKGAFVGYDEVLIPFAMGPSSRGKFLKENTGKSDDREKRIVK